MRKYVAAAFLIAITIGPAAALDLGVGVQAGGLGIGTSVGVGRKGASVGIGTSLGGLGGADAGASVGTSNGSTRRKRWSQRPARRRRVDAGHRSEQPTAHWRKHWSQRPARRRKRRPVGRHWGRRLDRQWRSRRFQALAPVVPPLPHAQSGRSTAATTASVAPAEGVRQSIALPLILWPSGRSDRSSAAPAIDEIPGTPRASCSRLP